ncbi:hypothetical protein NA56DRAFT_92501 [Hyaloscypha hepaticicola]|uniref:Uncharacterized protein n=1 Tax=Hyaloscypha hepaticicola TaxID=2082293 RepID=A0A2J6Q8L2_9HELO|nr:hypothetical protein NA56DRAFT_92501 [Hyaloscypha hepaticicola]
MVTLIASVIWIILIDFSSDFSTIFSEPLLTDVVLNVVQIPQIPEYLASSLSRNTHLDRYHETYMLKIKYHMPFDSCPPGRIGSLRSEGKHALETLGSHGIWRNYSSSAWMPWESGI